MVDGSFRGERLRPLVPWWTAARERASGKLRELARRRRVTRERWGLVGIAMTVPTVAFLLLGGCHERLLD
jgi:hypothetical protein